MKIFGTKENTMRQTVRQFLRQILGDREGYVIGGFKKFDPNTPFEKRKFVPKTCQDIDDFITWATPLVSQGDIYFGPMRRNIRSRNPRNQWEGQGGRWLWADVDWQRVPVDQQADVDRRIKILGSIVVASGSQYDGRANVQVYVRLSEHIDVRRHYALNEALSKLLCADSGFNDNKVLRVPETSNFKTDIPRQAMVVGGHGKRVNVDALEARLKVAQRLVKTRKRGWRRVDVSHIDPRLTRRARLMGPGEAIGIFGSRHQAALCITRELAEAGLTDDEVHTVMDTFAPAVDKWNDDQWHARIDAYLRRGA